MSPNPYVLLRNLANPRCWLARNVSQTEENSKRRVEHWQEPVPGLYEYVPGRGWHLTATDKDGGKLSKPVPLTYCRILHRFMLKDEFESRKKWGVIRDEHGTMARGILFRLDDGVTWIYCWNERGEFDARERKVPYCIDSKTGKFRVMRTTDRQDGPRHPSESAHSNTPAPQSRPSPSPSMRSFVEGDVYSAPSSWASPPSTGPSTRSSSRQGSSTKSGLQALPISTAATL